jgi:uncharacterized DUF497 family protein
MGIGGFDWGAGNIGKCTRHGVSIEAIFRAGPAVAPDIAHSAEEDRLIAVGRTAEGRPLFVAFTLRIRGGHKLVRPISARYMHKKEIEAYEKESAQAEKR